MENVNPNKQLSIIDLLEKEGINKENPMETVGKLMQNQELMQNIMRSFMAPQKK